MAKFHFQIDSIQRSRGESAVGAAAYRAGERLRDERANHVHNHSRRTDVTHKEIFLPSQLENQPMEWARDRAKLWNAAEAAERKRNSRVAREFQVSLPSELPAERRVTLARNFAREVSDRYAVAVDLAVHDPKPTGDARNFHAHLLMTTREVTPEGLGAKTGLDMQLVKRIRLGMTDHSEEFVAVRERWAALTNTALQEANLEARVDHRTLQAQGIDRQPMVYVPMEFYRAKAAGLDPAKLKEIRDSYRARVAARVVAARVNERSAHLAQPAVHEPPAPQTPLDPARGPPTVEEIRRRAIQNWLRMRSREAESRDSRQEPQRAKDADSSRTTDEGHEK